MVLYGQGSQISFYLLYNGLYAGQEIHCVIFEESAKVPSVHATHYFFSKSYLGLSNGQEMHLVKSAGSRIVLIGQARQVFPYLS